MKKLLILFALMLFLAACGGNEETVESTNENESDNQVESAESEDNVEETDKMKEKDSEESVEVDKGLMNVEVTIPSTLFETQNQDIDQVIADAKESGIKEVIENNDGSLTYKMSKSKHKEMMADLENQLNTTIEEVKNSEDFVSIQDVNSDKSFSEFTMSVDQEAFENSFDGFAALSLGISGMLYQLFDGVDPENYKVTIFVENVDTGEVFDTITYPEDLEQ
ncbi:hypothetical protein [Oceanobacillus salinisoli]|uniref:hypothetical protein n=1 Tax=Oceanobacillus salinisoli TaxID=2678611 RepID=UPI001E644BBD|nr:hypothetical protein [Oceanobacillus salinisoli]